MPYNDERELRERLQFLSNRDAWDLANILETAHRRVKSKYGRYIQEPLKQQVEDQKEFDLSFPDIFEFIKVYYNDEKVDAADYTVDKETGTITFTDSFADDKLKLRYNPWLVVYYTPKVYKDLEIFYAMQEIVSMNMVQTNDQDETNRLSQLNTTIRRIESDIIRSMPRYSLK